MVWGYTKENGPSTWASLFPIAGGSRQSPIDIRGNECKPCSGLAKISASYSGIQIADVSNNGHSWKAQVKGGSSRLKGGPLADEFILEQFHCHWGKTNDTGSEHTIDGKTYPAELHLVHWNKTKFNSFSEAAAADGGLAVLGVFLKVGKEHEELNKITKLLPFIQHKGQAITVTEPVNPASFIPKNGSYWTYSGSLTTPPCYESVSWIVYKDPMEVSQSQINNFRGLRSYHPCESCPKDEFGGNIVENYRPPCPLMDRQVKVFNEE
ncbi:carbonic anhydrase 1-like isoform X2 [Oratosquilla oratoria]|uniref:carbonic anhydrase 1-like isoform X2 n=1 Tax=Oratosquilla oratoria TaxID=337810 RepID=UPI003F761CFC